MIPDSIATASAREVLLITVSKAARAAIDDMLDSGQIDAGDALELNQEVSKALGAIPSEVGQTEVLKSLSYGSYTTDDSLLTQGAALTTATLTDYAKRRIAKALYDDTVNGLSPVSKAVGYVPPADLDEFRTDIADCFMQEFAVGADDALECADYFFSHFGG